VRRAGTLAWMIKTLREEHAAIGTEEQALARQIVGARASQLSGDEIAALLDAGRGDALAHIHSPDPDPNPDADDIDVAEDANSLLDVLAVGLVRLAREGG
jgi:hypothetical protein